VALNSVVPQTILNRYSDLNLSFIANPVRKDIGILYDSDAVKQAVVNLVLTKNYERPFHPEIGCNVTALLFDNITSITALSIQVSIQNVINNFEPRVQLQSVVVIADPDNNGYNATITFYVLNIPSLVTVDFFLERLR
jgi:phage baseplate assembly protein W